MCPRRAALGSPQGRRMFGGGAEVEVTGRACTVRGAGGGGGSVGGGVGGAGEDCQGLHGVPSHHFTILAQISIFVRFY